MGIFAITYYGFVQNIVIENVEDHFVEKRSVLTDISVRKSFFPVEIANCFSGKISTCFIVVPNFIKMVVDNRFLR